MKPIEIKAPNPLSYDGPLKTKVFLAGSIEMGAAKKWQEDIVDKLGLHVLAYNEVSESLEPDVVFLNPRREDWDSTWDQESDQFNEQVLWELNMLYRADVIVVYFDPNTKSPISLLELGLFASSKKLIVCCPDGFWRKGNVRIVCELYNIPLFNDYDQWVATIQEKLEK
jgi:hypothetical protein